MSLSHSKDFHKLQPHKLVSQSLPFLSHWIDHQYGHLPHNHEELQRIKQEFIHLLLKMMVENQDLESKKALYEFLSEVTKNRQLHQKIGLEIS